ncbi:hypothetical protein GCM10029976_009980 [Kribbella albertanoniae]|uniref:Novel STAND NTPase 1 domain-containing protein n=1 Tax=Kribbella albertanoniae TaxID=1266829 RepID=A0A4R4Q2M9_9ACTN|nr:hypothetical protein [Kribbella albertanoniae]TDC29281.1 hypothetical protein E1261_16220 [Kribbella albertanoniae]
MAEIDPDTIRTRGEFRDQLTLLRTSADLSVRAVRDLVKQAGDRWSHSTVGDWFAGRSLPSASSAELFVRVLRVCGVTSAEELERWLAAWRRLQRSPGRRGGVEPYRGLAAFRSEDAAWYFGRAELVDALVARVRELEADATLAVVGPSGSGKSSLLRAGLIAALENERAVVVLTPGDLPAKALRAAISDADGRPLLIVVDQLEEMFTLSHDEARRIEFSRLLTVERPPDSVVVLGLRADFYPHALRIPELAAVLQSDQIVLGPMPAKCIKQMIVEPARRAGVAVDNDLVERLLSEYGSLPLLSHALLATWERASNGRMTLAGYLSSGGIAGAVALSAEQAYGRLTASERNVARELFLRMVNPGDRTGDSRRPIERTDLDDTADTVVEAFVAVRLLTVDVATIEISHEALLTAWPRLQEWIESDRDSLHTLRQLGAAAVDWRDKGRDTDYLYRGSRLEQTNGILPRRMNALELEFLSASLVDERLANAARRRRSRRRNQLVAVSLVLALIAGTMAVVSYLKTVTADEERDRAWSRQLAISATRLRATDPALAAQLALSAYRISPTVEARSSLIEATGSPSVTRVVRPVPVPQAIAVTSDGRTLIGAGSAPTDTSVLRWDLGDRRRPVPAGEPLGVHKKEVYAAAVSADNKLLATGGADLAVKLWDISRPGTPRALGDLPDGPTNTVYSLAFGPSGDLLASGSADSTVRLWKLDFTTRSYRLVHSVKLGDFVQTVAISRDGRWLAAGDRAGTLTLWDLPRWRRVGVVSTGSLQINTLAFTPAGNELAVGTPRGGLQLWAVPALRRVASAIAPPDNWVNSLAFSTDGDRLALGSSDNVAQVWDRRTGILLAALPHPAPVTAVTFLPGEQELLTSSNDGTVRIWSIPGPTMAGATATVTTVPLSRDGRVAATVGGQAQLWDVHEPRSPIALSPPLLAPGNEPLGGAGALKSDGSMLAVGTNGRSLIAWDTRDPARPRRLLTPLTGPAGIIESVAFNADGTLLAAGSDDGHVWLWDSTDPTKPVSLPNPLDAESGYVFMVAFSPRSNLLAAATAKGTIRWWDVTDPRRPVLKATRKASLDALYAVAFDSTGNLLASGSSDGKVQLWNVENPAAPQQLGSALSGLHGTVTSVAFSPDAQTLSATSRGGQLWTWSLDNPSSPTLETVVSASPKAVWGLALAPDGHTTATAGSDRLVRLWETDPERAATLICTTATPALTPEEWATHAPGIHRPNLC